MARKATETELASGVATNGEVAEPEVATTEGQVGHKVDQVELGIDYAIIEHFSRHLYGSPNKAVEELVANSFDAFAYSAYVYIPGGGQVADRVVVWDDGDSMDIEALKRLWWIARSPKNDGSDRVVTAGDRTRSLIGKFGIGKLASYAVGKRISHLCKKDGRFLLVGVDYTEIEDEMRDEEPGKKVFRSPILELSDEEAVAWIDGCFVGDPKARDELLGKDAFTIAVVDGLRDVDLSPGRLRWVLGNAMPLRPDFQVFVNDDAVETRLGRDATTTWEIDAEQIMLSLRNAWTEAVEAGRVEGELSVGEPTTTASGEERPVVEFPKLGPVSARVSLFEHSLKREGESRDERSYGFFVMVRERLLNVEDAELFLSPPSYGTFFRSQFVVYADRLDSDLLADRERVRENPRSRELAILQQGLYRAARIEVERQDEAREEADNLINLLPVSSRSLFRDPVMALLLREGDAEGASAFDFSEPSIQTEDLLDSQPASILDVAASTFRVNASHPFIRSLRDELGSSKAAQKALRVIELLAVSDKLLEGYLLYEIGLSTEQAQKVADWRDELLRSLATRYAQTPEEIVAELRNSSFKGDKRFEAALASLFNLMGFVAQRKGGSGDEDVLVVGPTGETATRFTLEGKGSKSAVANDDAELASAKSHAVAAGASLAVVVAREFVGFATEGDPAVLREAQAVSDDGEIGVTVSVVDVDTLIDLFATVQRFAYPLEVIVPVLSVVESPSDKRARIAELASPVEQFDYRALLDEVWRAQQEEAADDWVPIRALWQKLYKEQDLRFQEDLVPKLAALDALAPGLIRLDLEGEKIVLLQAPDVVAEHITRSLA